VPAARRRHWVTETPPVKEALDELRAELGTDSLPFDEVIVRGASVKLAELRGDGDEKVERLRHRADQIRADSEI
jgi:hypothetical protein